MTDLQKNIEKLSHDFESAILKLDLVHKKKELQKLSQATNEPSFWNDNLKAQQIMKKIADLDRRITPWEKLGNSIHDLLEITTLQDETLTEEVSKQYTQLKKDFESLKYDLHFQGKYDDHDVVITLTAGAGGTDAQDWTAMLLRMYNKWAESQQYKVSLIEESAGEEAGLKRAVFEISGSFMYGRLASESGVHRLVRLSPFNADNLRQTSFAKVDVVPKIDKPEELEIDPQDLKIDVYRAGGHGGQSVNTTDSAVRVTHIPTGITVAIQNERSQLQNKETAMTILRSRLAVLQEEQHKEHLKDLKGPNQAAEWGNQIRSYVLHPYKLVKDNRTKYETSDAEDVLNGDLNPFISAYLESNIT